jgi:hypothetical protein
MAETMSLNHQSSAVEKPMKEILSDKAPRPYTPIPPMPCPVLYLTIGTGASCLAI